MAHFGFSYFHILMMTKAELQMHYLDHPITDLMAPLSPDFLMLHISSNQDDRDNRLHPIHTLDTIL